MKFDTLYKKDTSGSIRTWYMETDGAKKRTVSGVQDGKQVVSGWNTTHAKNVGKVNATTAEEQAVAEVKATYKKKLERDYHASIKDVDKERHVKPMLADKWEDVKDKVTYPLYTQPKLDGIRCIAKADGLWTRQGKPILAVPHIVEALAPYFKDNPDAILDGELYTHEYKDNFNKIISLVRKTKPTDRDLMESAAKVEYHVYDVPSSTETFKKRYGEYKRAVRSINSNCVVAVATHAATTEEEVDMLYGEFLEEGYEGGIVRTNDLYEFKRSKTLLKRKDFEDMEFEIVDILEGEGNWAGYAKRVIIRLEDGRTCSSGLAATQEYAKQILAEKEQYVGKQATVQYFTRTPDGIPRFPVTKALHLEDRW